MDVSVKKTLFGQNLIFIFLPISFNNINYHITFNGNIKKHQRRLFSSKIEPFDFYTVALSSSLFQFPPTIFVSRRAPTPHVYIRSFRFNFPRSTSGRNYNFRSDGKFKWKTHCKEEDHRNRVIFSVRFFFSLLFFSLPFALEGRCRSFSDFFFMVEVTFARRLKIYRREGAGGYLLCRPASVQREFLS